MREFGIPDKCRKCGQPVNVPGQYLIALGEFFYHHDCYPVSPAQVRIAELECENAALRGIIARNFADKIEADLASTKGKQP